MTLQTTPTNPAVAQTVLAGSSVLPEHDTRLLIDLNANGVGLALTNAPQQLHQYATFEHPADEPLYELINRYLRKVRAGHVQHAVIASASPLQGDDLALTNAGLHVSIEQTRAALGLDTLLVVNDFTALAMAVPLLKPEERTCLGGQQQQSQRSPIGIIGTGKGLGVSALVPTSNGWLALATEGGHVGFSPMNATENTIWTFAHDHYGHVSAERLVSFSGLELVHAALQPVRSKGVKHGSSQIVRNAQAGDALANHALQTWCEMLGSVASNVALTYGAQGGIYLMGAPFKGFTRILAKSGFRARFQNKGRLSTYVAGIPTYTCHAEQALFLGAASILEAELARRAPQASVLHQTETALSTLSKGEHRVAQWLLANPKQFMNSPVTDIANATGVSQPTVIRFCRSLGFAGLPDFKLKLASSLTGSVSLNVAQVANVDQKLKPIESSFQGLSAALEGIRDHLDPGQLSEAARLIARARRIEIFGPSAAHIGTDLQQKCLMNGLNATVRADWASADLAGRTLSQDDVFVWIAAHEGSSAQHAAVAAMAKLGVLIITVGPHASALQPMSRCTLRLGSALEWASTSPWAAAAYSLLWAMLMPQNKQEIA